MPKVNPQTVVSSLLWDVTLLKRKNARNSGSQDRNTYRALGGFLPPWQPAETTFFWNFTKSKCYRDVPGQPDTRTDVLSVTWKSFPERYILYTWQGKQKRAAIHTHLIVPEGLRTQHTMHHLDPRENEVWVDKDGESHLILVIIRQC